MAYIAAICASGFTPRATLEIAGSDRRLDKIYNLIRKCQYSIHDLSRVELDKIRPRVPRFNMPFELGLAVAWALESERKHKWFVFESVSYRLSKSLSDINGTDAYIHNSRVNDVFVQIRNAFPRSHYWPSTENMRKVYTALVAQAGEKDIFQRAEFSDLIYAAMGISQKMRESKEIKKAPATLSKPL